MPRSDWNTELDFSPEELADMGAELVHRAGPAAPGGEAPAAPPPRRRRPSSLRIPVDSVPRTDPGSAPAVAAPGNGGRVSASDVVVERAFQLTTRGFVSAATVQEPAAESALEPRTFDQTIRGYSAPDSAVPVLAPVAVTAPSAPPPPAAPVRAASAAPSDDAIALDDADMIMEQVDGAHTAEARRAWPEHDTPPMGADLATLEAPPGAATASAAAGSTPRPRGESAFRKVDTVPEAVAEPPAEAPTPAPPVAAPPAPESRTESAVVLAVFDAFDSRPNSILRTEAAAAAAAPPVAADARSPAEVAAPAEAARADAAPLEPPVPTGTDTPVDEDLEPEITAVVSAEEPPEELSGADLEEISEAPVVKLAAAPARPVAATAAATAAAPVAAVAPAATPAASPAAAVPTAPAAAPVASPAPAAPGAVGAAAPAPPAAAVAPAAAHEEPQAEELSGSDLEEIPDIIADQVMAGPPPARHDDESAPREAGAVAVEMMAAAMTSAPRAVDEEGEELSGADLEEVHEPPAPVAPPVPVAPSRAPAEAAKAPPPTPTEEAKPVRRRRKRPWFEEVFDEDYLRTLPYLTPEQTKREVDFLIDGLNLERDMHVLDVGCGYGRHSMELAARGYKVTGIDLSLALLIRAADEAQRRGLQVNFVHGDMRELSFDEPFDAAFCMGTSFGFFDDEANRKVLQGLSRVVRPEGRFLVEVVNRDYIVGDLPARVWWEGDGCVVLEEVEFNYYTSRLIVRRSVVFEDGRQLEHDISVRVYSLHEIGRILQYAGFRVLDVSGHLSTRGRFFGAASRQILVVAERRPALSSE